MLHQAISPDDDTMSETNVSIAHLMAAGFRPAGRWETPDGASLARGFDVDRKPGVYVYAVNGVIAYVGSAQRGLHRRLRHYEISKKMKTAMRIRSEILASLARGDAVDVYLLPAPPAMFWNGLPVDAIAGIEDGLIRKINPPWNIRGSRRTARVVSGA
ncbi:MULTISPECIES: GIY-YIG nuclease family protein [unclassified Shinella]|uniref:GIY-YIG nuclease family protein n=1 Tax=unclassified Shinella TaxID=2643062 RepID=UPI00225D80F2|nr:MULTISPECIES: GIY-YIG nuclease family protein [unclassified Shinella]MCO5153639.1 GIY-YIG nuclease family protein [Shinella sp.]MDC7259896.1 GIY-YIG nuclease family protein [Shinella sp. YE25]CAI0341757.1 GIY-YIG nuclease family protein [Rhizobiaceae bacterium]CAK7262075.1 GIY-YIG domain-containing protein [Shinella sp. WSC3-e]